MTLVVVDAGSVSWEQRCGGRKVPQLRPSGASNTREYSMMDLRPSSQLMTPTLLPLLLLTGHVTVSVSCQS